MFSGAVNDTVACTFPAVAITPVGGPGAVETETHVGMPVFTVKNCPSWPIGSLIHLYSL